MRGSRIETDLSSLSCSSSKGRSKGCSKGRSKGRSMVVVMKEERLDSECERLRMYIPFKYRYL